MTTRAPTRTLKRKAAARPPVAVPVPRTRKSRLPQRVRLALADFQQRVLEAFPDDIAQIILFGSYARGEATPDSDVDVLVVTQWREADPQREARITQAASAALLTHGADISPFVFTERQFNGNNPLVADAKENGIVLWRKEKWTMSDEQELLPADPNAPQTWLDLALPKLDDARKTLEAGVYAGAVSQAYYAMFYACRAALLTQGLYLKKHSAMIDKFRELLVLTGKIEESYLTLLGSGQTAREKSDYEPFTPTTRADAEKALASAESFIARMQTLVEKHTPA